MRAVAVLTLLISVLFSSYKAQDKIPNDFRFPLDGNIRFSGNYGELRPNHFHAGLDFRTDPVKNLPIYAAGDGYVSRIKIGTHGYGKVLYVTHPNGYVTVYGHEHHFAKKIADFAYAEQKKQESFEVEIFPDANALPVKKGEIIGYSGNTGNSSGPHLHFEIREEKTETPLNPQLFFKHEDNLAPVCTKMVIYTVPDQGKPVYAKSLDLSKKSGNKEMIIDETIQMPANAGLAFSCYDKENADAGKNQVYGISIKVNGEQIYMHKMNNISFENSRYVNWFQDMDLKNEKLQKCFRTGNNELPIFTEIKNQGLITSYDGKLKPGTHNAEVKFFDVNGNTTTLKFRYTMNEKDAAPKFECNFDCMKENLITLGGATVKFPEKCLFYNTNTDVKLHKQNPGRYYSDVYKIFNSDMPVLKSYDVALEIGKTIPTDKTDKLCLLTMKNDMSGISYAGGKFENGKLVGSIKNCGLVTVGIDTIIPNITAHPQKGKKKMSLIRFTVSDNLSGIGKFRMEINGAWVLAEYEHKTNSIFYIIDDKTPKGKLKVELKVWDKQQNLAISKVSVQN
jgi:murein DD-endopeptidase MepM/ murein hydrolase activator NlpD